MVNAAHIRDTCGSCHGNVRLTSSFGLPSDRVVSFNASYHGLAGKAGSQTVANCSSCHGVHNILPSSDPKSTINPKNLPKTCGQCHAGAGTRFAISQVHLTVNSESAALRWVRQFYLLLIPVTIGLMMLHQGGDWIRKLVKLRFQRRIAQPGRIAAAGHGELRMLPFERVQHAVMALSFLTLIWKDPTAEEASNGPHVDFVPARFIGRIGDPAAVRRKAASCFVELRARNRNRFAICRPATKGKQPYVVGEKVIKVQEKAPVRHLLCKGTLLQNPIAFF